MAWSFNNVQPIYLQISDEIKARILRGQYKMGERLPSVRDIAIEAEVNPNTVQRALQELETQGMIKTEGTSGRFVTDDDQTVKQARDNIIAGLTKSYLEKLRALGINPTAAIAYIKQEEELHNE